MKHMVRNDELLEKIGFDLSKPHPVVYSCEFDDGRKAQHVDPLRLGAGGMEIWFFPCFSCAQQLHDYVMEPLFLNAAKAAIKEKRQQEARTIVYRGVVLIPLPDYEVPGSNSSEWKSVEREIDKYLDEGAPMMLVGFQVSPIEQSLVNLTINHDGARLTKKQIDAIANELKKAVE